jgi:NAD(P)-dependent dehydrogenase (short-subunit alcohol dehydrogenase family)
LAAVAGGLPEGAEVLIVPTDMTDRAQVRALVDGAHERFGRIGILINNAGQTLVGPVETFTPDNYRRIIEVNVFGPLHAMQAAVPAMRSKESLMLTLRSCSRRART